MLTIVDREVLVALAAGRAGTPHPAWMARMEAEGWIRGRTGSGLTLNPLVYDWMTPEGALSDAARVWSPVRVTLDSCAEDPDAPWVLGYINGERWNGSVVPYLPEASLTTLLQGVGLSYTVDPVTGEWVVEIPGSDLDDRFVASEITLDPTRPPQRLFDCPGWLWSETEYPACIAQAPA